MSRIKTNKIQTLVIYLVVAMTPDYSGKTFKPSSNFYETYKILSNIVFVH